MVEIARSVDSIDSLAALRDARNALTGGPNGEVVSETAVIRYASLFGRRPPLRGRLHASGSRMLPSYAAVPNDIHLGDITIRA